MAIKWPNGGTMQLIGTSLLLTLPGCLQQPALITPGKTY